MIGRSSLAVLGFLLAFGLTGCSATIGLYHSAEGGAIAQKRQAPPGAAAPYPSLASVPTAPTPPNAAAQTAVASRLAPGAPPATGGVSAPSPLALAGLTLPGQPPPAPVVPDLVIPHPAALAAPAPALKTAAAPATPPSAPVALAFPPGTALLDPNTAVALRGIAAATGGATVLVGGFGEAATPTRPALALALARAERLADALTANGVPPTAIRLLAMASGSGGFVQLFYWTGMRYHAPALTFAGRAKLL